MTERDMLGYRWRYEADKLYTMGKCNKRWRCCNDRKPNSKGYIHVGVNRKLIKLHRLVYLFHHPEWDITDTSSANQIDHINGDKMNNSISNLRVVNNSQNMQNHTHYDGREIKGVYYDRQCKRWRAYWREDGREIRKWFATEEEALAYRRKMVRIHYTHAPI